MRKWIEENEERVIIPIVIRLPFYGLLFIWARDHWIN